MKENMFSAPSPWRYTFKCYLYTVETLLSSKYQRSAWKKKSYEKDFPILWQPVARQVQHKHLWLGQRSPGYELASLDNARQHREIDTGGYSICLVAQVLPLFEYGNRIKACFI